MNYRKGQQRPLTVSLKLEPADAALLENLARLRRQRTAQATIVGILREYHQFREMTQEDRVENIEWKQLYFDLAESTSALRMAAENLVTQIDGAAASEKLDRRRRLSLA